MDTSGDELARAGAEKRHATLRRRRGVPDCDGLPCEFDTMAGPREGAR